MGEYVSEDILDQNFINTFWAIHFPQMLMGSCRVDAKDRFVTAPSVLQRVYTVAVALFNVALSTTIIDLHTAEFYRYPPLYKLSLVSWILLDLAYVANVLHVRFLNRESNVNLYLKMQKLDRTMKVSEDLNHILRRINNVSVLLIIAVMVALFFVTINGGIALVFGYTAASLLSFPFVLEIINCSNSLVYFFLRVRFINSILKNHLKPKKYTKDKYNRVLIATKAHMRQLAANSHDFLSSPTDDYLREIFDCFTLYQDTYQFQVCMFFFNLMLLIVIAFEFGLLSLQIGINATAALLNLTVMMTTLLLQIACSIFMCLRCELFFREVTETKRLSIAVLALHYEGPLRTKAKNMYKTIEDSPPRFSVYDMWNLDARIIIRIFNTLNTIFVALLQFTFV